MSSSVRGAGGGDAGRWWVYVKVDAQDAARFESRLAHIQLRVRGRVARQQPQPQQQGLDGLAREGAELGPEGTADKPEVTDRAAPVSGAAGSSRGPGGPEVGA